MKIRRDILDDLFSKFIRLRADGRCEYCGQAKSFKDLQCSHFHGRRKRSTRYDPQNACAVCFSCHQYLGEHPNKHAEFFRKRLGSDEYEKLNIRAETPTKIDRELIKSNLKEQIRLLGGE